MPRFEGRVLQANGTPRQGAVIEQSLVADSLVYRYRVDDAFSDGLPGGEGTFSMCSFWYVE